jgi:hypothetical protein
VLDADAWNHVVDRHPEMAGRIDDVMRALSAPEFREPDIRVGRERFFATVEQLGWIRVVTGFADSFDRVVTAFPQASDPRPRRGQR